MYTPLRWIMALFWVPSLALADTSQLWGEQGELWDPLGRLPDFSYAGYHMGEDIIPDVAQVVHVADHGAVGDGSTDDTAAIQSAIDAASEGGAVVFDAASYLLEGRLQIQHSGVVLRGAGSEEDGTVLLFQNSLETLIGESSTWSWSGGLIEFSPTESPSSVSAVAADALRGDTALVLDDASGVTAGDLVMLYLSDDSGSLELHLHNDQDGGGDCDWQQPYNFRWPVRVEAVEGNTLTLSQPLRIDTRSEWSPTVYTAPFLSEVGVESLSIAFPDDIEYSGHLDEPGYNGITFAGGVVDGWARDIAIVNADNGILPDPWSKNLTFSDIELLGRDGHHGFNLNNASDLLVQRVHVGVDFIHAFTVDHKTNGSVFRQCTSDFLMELDHHRDGSFENLFTDIDAETSFYHGGSSCAGPSSGARETFWNMADGMFLPYWGANQANVVGVFDGEELMTEDQEWYETVEELWPPDLYEAQRAFRLGLDYAESVDSGSTGEDTAGSLSEAKECGCASRDSGPVGWVWLVGLLGLLGLRSRPQGLEVLR